MIGAGGRYIRADKALDAIAGFVVLNDASAREWQRAGTQWTAGKNFEGSMPIGPEVVTTDEADVTDAALTTTLNGMVMQSARTSQMIVDVPSAIEFFSSFTRLLPGDVIATGTPGGVGFARTAAGLAAARRRHRGHHRGRGHHPQPRGRRGRRARRLAVAAATVDEAAACNAPPSHSRTKRRDEMFSSSPRRPAAGGATVAAGRVLAAAARLGVGSSRRASGGASTGSARQRLGADRRRRRAVQRPRRRARPHLPGLLLRRDSAINAAGGVLGHQLTCK